MGIIYCYTNLINGKKYVGQTINPDQRYNQHKSSAFNENDKDYDTPLHRAFRKYGYDNFDYNVLLIAEDINILNELEVYYIEKYDCKIPNGYNILDGGLNSERPHSEEAKINMSKAKATLTDDEIIYLRNAYKDKLSPTEIYNELYKDKMHFQSFLNIWTGKRYSHIMPDVFKDKGRHTKLNKEIAHNIKKDRAELNLSYAKLAEKYNISKSTISDVCNGRTWKDA